MGWRFSEFDSFWRERERGLGGFWCVGEFLTFYFFWHYMVESFHCAFTFWEMMGVQVQFNCTTILIMHADVENSEGKTHHLYRTKSAILRAKHPPCPQSFRFTLTIISSYLCIVLFHGQVWVRRNVFRRQRIHALEYSYFMHRKKRIPVSMLWCVR